MNLTKCVRLQQVLMCVGVRHQWISTGNVNFTQLAEEFNPEWNQAVCSAEKILGYPSSYFNLRALQSIKSVNDVLRDLETSNHPFLNIAKSLIYNEKNMIQTWGLVVLLISKAVGYPLDTPDADIDKPIGILHNQRSLSELAEKIRLGIKIHKNMVNLLNVTEDKTMLQGNKLSILSGDYLLAHCYAGLASLKNQEVFELISVALRDLSEAEFVGPRDKQNLPLPAKPKKLGMENFSPSVSDSLNVSEALNVFGPLRILSLPNKPKHNLDKFSLDKSIHPDLSRIGPLRTIVRFSDSFNLPDFIRQRFTMDKTEKLLSDNFSIYPINISQALGHAKSEWTIRHTLSSGSLLGKSCQGTLMLAKQSIELQEQAYLFGIHFALAMQASLDYETFLKFSEKGNEPFSLISAPVMFQLEHDPDLYYDIERGKKNILDVDYEVVYEAVVSGPGLKKTRQLQKEHSQKALESLQNFPPNESRSALGEILCAL